MDLANSQYVIAGDRRFFVYRTERGEHLFLEDRCAHRGGPLSLGRRCPGGGIVCPWHGIRYSETRLARFAYPMIRSQCQWAILFGDKAAEPGARGCTRRVIANEKEWRASATTRGVAA